ncbi:MAG: N-acetyl sugar amidotransferase [Gammaproteobacteria bacterium]
MPDGRERPYRMCTRCVMDTTDPLIEFDEKGVCNHCHYFENNVKPNWFPDDEGAVRLQKMLEEVKAYGRNRRYDCIVGVSGGVDSSYLTAKIVEWGLRPLMVHVDAGWNSELAVKNIETLINRLGLDLVTHVVNWEEMKDLQLAFLRSNLANQDVPQDHAFFAALYNYAVKEKVKYVISGSNYATESILPQAWGYDAMDVKHLEAIHDRFGKRPLKTFPRVSFFNFYIYYPRVLEMKVLTPLNYMPYSKAEAIKTLERDYGWRYYGGKHYESRWTRFFQAHYLPIKFGYDKRKAHLSSLVVAGEISREDAIVELQAPLYDDRDLAEDKLFISKKLGITVAELDALIAAPPRHYSEFPNNEARKLQAMETLQKYRKVSARAFALLRRFAG